MRRVYFLAYNSRNYFKVDDVMKLLSKVNLEDTDFPGEGYFRDEEFEVEEVIGVRTVLLYFDVEVVVDYYDNYIDGMFESRHVRTCTVSVEYNSGYFTDDGDVVVVTERRRKEIEREVAQLIINQL